MNILKLTIQNHRPKHLSSLIFWGWFLGTIGPFCFAFLVGFILALCNVPEAIIGVFALILYSASSIAAIVISIILVCSPSTTGRVNGIILLVLFVLSAVVLLSTGGAKYIQLASELNCSKNFQI